ncbi:MAG TPA: GatB/YqeY domain-containing protein [Candidatus Omnitrophota bacterium]|mgnify:CR=1 FL=1|nr:GatB/YqeY domain-containing protein [Candidatus Omnitrophota bacterium]HPB67833.1 GatB/YqeY domain-containing protein [Candidatus Omnitrophota bacterium]HQO58757.1 GatB/YqeY domain-containing protein [Candidatus Omnitrophota bacterium]HQP11996.1 GatB/YqeY domain-containing protein [Candidatus Omnitrophota bacterium]
MLADTISRDYIQAMKQKESVKVSTLSFLRAQMKNVQIDLKVDQLTDEQVQDVIKKQVKQRRDSIAQYEKGGRPELADKETQEMNILLVYLPAQLGTAQLQPVVQESIRVVGAQGMKDMGRVMKEVLSRVGDGADNRLVSELVKKELSGL